MDSVHETPGVREAVASFHTHGAITAIISGAFKELADRMQRVLKVHHSLSGCEYFFDPATGLLEHWNLMPSDYEGKVDFMKLIMKEYQIRPSQCAFIGDGMNDVCLAQEVGISIAFNAQPELREICTYIIDQPTGKEDFTAVSECLDRHSNHYSGEKSVKFLNDYWRRKLILEARLARDVAYAPYSHDFKVGASVLTEDDEVFSGCNVENASFGATVCAERVAVFKAIAAGKRQIRAVAVIADTPEPIPPCGICRQVIAEFGPDCKIIMSNIAGDIMTTTMRDFFPGAFTFNVGDDT
jgi:homotetrameric cytidine deaminase